MSDDNFFRRIGIPASLAALISAAVTMSFFMFQIDNRYAKSELVEQESRKLDEKIDAALLQLSQLNGSVQVLIQISDRLNIEQKRLAEVSDRNRTQSSSTTPVELSSLGNQKLVRDIDFTSVSRILRETNADLMSNSNKLEQLRNQ